MERFTPSEARSSGAGALQAALRRLDALIDWERRDRAPVAGPAMRVDTEPARDLCTRLGSPQTRLQAVHVAGTKGKGSVCALVDAALRGLGFRVGRYASPHVERVTERVCLGGRAIDDGALAGSWAGPSTRGRRPWRTAARAARRPGSTS